MTELGKYAATVLWSYVGGLGLIAVLILVSLWQSARVRSALAEAEARQDSPHV